MGSGPSPQPKQPGEGGGLFFDWQFASKRKNGKNFHLDNLWVGLYKILTKIVRYRISMDCRTNLEVSPKDHLKIYQGQVFMTASFSLVLLCPGELCAVFCYARNI